ncbi:MAG: phosphatidylserine decarboxylase, partial [Sphingomonadales bacterium]
PIRAGLLVSPADGVVQMVVKAPPPPELDMGDEPRTRISVFMNVFNVHVNRVPADGEITGLAYTPGKFFNATLDKASEDNERQAVRMTTAEGKDIAFVQIAGLIARRIVCYIEEGRKVAAGERFGVIRFGSRVDIYLDEGMNALVIPGQTTVAGETVLADCKSKEARRKGETR